MDIFYLLCMKIVIALAQIGINNVRDGWKRKGVNE